MSGYDYSVTLMLPASLERQGNQMFRALGRDGTPAPGATFIGRAEGAGRAAFVFCEYAARQSDLDELKDIEANGLPAEPPAGGSWADYDLSAKDRADVVAALEVYEGHRNAAEAVKKSMRHAPLDQPAAHWKAVLAARGRTKVEAQRLTFAVTR